MSSSKPAPKPVDAIPRRTSSQALRAYREKQESIEENTMPFIRGIRERLENANKRVLPSPIPREEPPTDPPPSNDSEEVEGT